ncbi:MAG: DUF1579 domain-containing protein, partial [Gemmataceae bacterium]
QPQKEHRWLDRLVGQWESEMEASMAPGQPPTTTRGTETVRSLGGLWVLCEGRSEMPGGGTGTTLMTLGFDPAKKRFVGSFIGSMMNNLWLYEGTLDADEKVLTLDTHGPSFTTPGLTAPYKDAIVLVSDDERQLTSSFQGDDGQWHHFMTATYRRVK